MSKNQNSLELIVRNYIHPKGNVSHPVYLNESQLTFLSSNWKEVKGIFSDLIKEGNGFFHDITHTLKNLKQKHGVFLTEDEGREIYSSLIEQERIRDIEVLSHSIEIKPSKEQIDNMWVVFLKGHWNAYLVNGLQKELGKPNLTQEYVDNKCNEYLEILAGERKGKDNQRIQLEDISKFVDVVGKSPNWDKELAQKAFNYRLSSNICVPLFKFLIDVVGVKPEEEKLQQYYSNLLLEKDVHSGNIEYVMTDLEKAIDITGIVPNKEIMDKFYQKNLGPYDFEQLRRAEEITKIKIEEQDFQEKYAEFIMEGKISSIIHLRNKSKINPEINEETVQEAYSLLLDKGYVKDAIQVYLFTDIEPKIKRKSVKKAFNQLIKEKDSVKGKRINKPIMESFGWLLIHFPDYTEHIASDYVSNLILGERFKAAEEFIRELEIEPKSEDQYVLACQRADWETAKSIFDTHKKEITEKYPSYSEVLGHI